MRDHDDILHVQDDVSELSVVSTGATDVGSVLAEARRAWKLDVADVAQELKIQPRYLTAIEKGSYWDLPNIAYATGFVRSYATYLGLDGAGLVAKFRDELASKPSILGLSNEANTPNFSSKYSRGTAEATQSSLSINSVSLWVYVGISLFITMVIYFYLNT